jgi:hypothetical protein
VTANALAWYDELRQSYRPARRRVLLIGESPPDPASGARRFFYAPTLSHDNLFRGVAQAIYGDTVDLRNKVAVLEHLRDDGFWLIDAVDRPINQTTSGARRCAIAGAVPQLTERCRQLAPERGAIICHGLVYELAAAALRREQTCRSSTTKRFRSHSVTGERSSSPGCFRPLAMARLERDASGAWTLVLEPGDEGRNADHDEAAPRYLTALDPAFTRAREQSEFEFILTLLRVRGLADAGWDAYETTLRAIPAMTQLHESIAPGDENFEAARHGASRSAWSDSQVRCAETDEAVHRIHQLLLVRSAAFVAKADALDVHLGEQPLARLASIHAAFEHLD